MNQFDVIVIGGSYSGLAASMTLARALQNILIIDSGKPCNRQTPHSHNFLTQDGNTPADISALAKSQVAKYENVKFHNGIAVSGKKTTTGFEISTASGEIFKAKKLVFATGIKDIMPSIPGVAECWGITVIHCPFCHGYEVRGATTGILGNGEYGFDFSIMISNWTSKLTLYTNGPSTLTSEQTAVIGKKGVTIVEKPVDRIEHINGMIQSVLFKDGTKATMDALYTRVPFEQSSDIPASLGCELTEDGYIKVDAIQRTTVPGVFASGDNTTRMRSISIAVGMGTMAGMAANRELIFEGI